MSLMHTSPINQLPPETLAEILCLVPSKGIQLATQDYYPWNLALVCRFWRDVVFSKPQLWTNIAVILNPPRLTKFKVRFDTLVAAWRLCLERSGSCPLSIDIGTSSSKSIELIPSLLKPLMEHVEQWETMVLGFTMDLVLPFISDPNIRYPRLREVFLRGGAATVVPEIKLFQDAPLLSRISLHEFPYPPGRIGLPWNQITDLTMHMNAGDVCDLLDTLRSTPNLTTFEFSVFIPISTGSAASPNQTHLQLPHLRTLSWATYKFNVSYFFDSVSMPNLSELRFQCEDGSWDRESMQRFLVRSKCTITSLTLRMTSSYLASSFLSILPDVEFLKLYSVFGNEELMHTLTFDKSATSWVCPKLRKIVMDVIHVQDEMHESFVMMVQSRLRTPVNPDPAVPERGHRLELLQVELSPDLVTDQVGLFKAFKVLQGRLLPDELARVTYKEKIKGD